MGNNFYTSQLTQLNGFKYSDPAFVVLFGTAKWFPVYLIIKQFYLTYRWDPNTPSQSGPGSNGNKGLPILPKALGRSLTLRWLSIIS